MDRFMPVSSFRLHPHVIATLLALNAMSALAQTAAAPATLSTVTVDASADASAAGLAKPFAGGQVARGGRVGILGNQDVMDTPFSTTSYTSELIQDQQAKSVADVLLNNPSVRQARGFGNFQEVYNVRGFLLYSDDIAYNGLYGMLPRQYVASELFERVEVFLGANTFLNGAAPGGSGIGGAINLLPKRAPNEPLTSIGFGVQSGGQAAISADLARRFGPDQSTGIRINAVRRDGGTGVDDEKRELSALSIGLDWHNRNVRVSADVGYQDHKLSEGRPNVTPSATLPLPAVPDADKNYAQPWTYAKERDTFATARAEVDLNDNITAWTALGVRNSTESNVLANPTVINAAGDTTAYRFDNVRKDKVTTGELGVRGKFQTGSIGHTVSVSAASYDNDRKNAYAFSNFGGFSSNLYAPVDVNAPVANALLGGVLTNPLLQATIKTSSFAIADTLSFAQDTVLVTLGARRQKIEQIGYDYNTGAQTDSYDASRTTPVAGVLFKATKNVSVYGNYIEGLQPGTTAPASSGGTAITNVGQIFEPYHSKQKEVGVKYDGGNIGASVGVFSIDQPLSAVVNGRYGPYGQQRNQGVELTVFGEPVKGLRVLGGLTLLDAQQRHTTGGATDGKDAIGVAKSQFNLGGEWDVPGVRGLALNTRLIYTSKQYANATNTQQLPSWTRVDAGVRYLMDIGGGKVLTLRGRVENLANKSYWASAGGYPGAGYLVQAAPRTFVLNGTIDF
jgi:iron complex outermembrane receptor protein